MFKLPAAVVARCFRSRTRAVLAVLAVAAAALALPRAASAGVVQSGVYDTFHRQWADKYPQVGRFELQFGAGDALCSGVLIGDRYVLTAGHCILSEGDTVSNMWFNIGGDRVRAQSWAIHPAWDGELLSLLQGRDIALVKLKRPVNAGKVSAYARGGNFLDKTVVSVGYGATGVGPTGETLPAGTKRAGENRIDIDGPKDFPISEPTDFNRLFIVDFDFFGQGVDNPDEDYPLSREYLAARGDSGGGIFSGGTLVGITSFRTGNSAFGDTAGYTRVQNHARWIKRTLNQLRRGYDRANFGRPGDLIEIPGGDPNGTPSPNITVNLPIGNRQLSTALHWTSGPHATGPAATVPEPATATLLAAAALALHRRRRR